MASTTCSARCSRPSAVIDPDQAPSSMQRVGHLGLDRTPGRPRAPPRRPAPATSRPRVDRRLVRAHGRRAAHAGASPGSSSRHSRPRSHSTSRSSELHQLEPAPQLLRLVAVERDVERAAGLVADLAARCRPRARPRTPARLGRRRAPAASAPPRPSSPRPTGASIPAATLGGAGARADRARAPERAAPGAPPATRRPARSPRRRPPSRRGASGAPSAARDRLQRHDDVVALASGL